MLDFMYYNPVRVHFGKNALEALPGELEKFGKRVLLVYGGGSIKRTGLYDRITDTLRAAGKEIFELAGVMPNPRAEKVYEGIGICRREDIDLLLAVGGGSTIDCAKAIAVGAKTDRDFWEAFYKNWEEAEDAIPLGVVLTLPATGSELDKSSVITNMETHEKNGYDSELFYPKFSILDPTLTYTLPKNQMVNGIVDTVSHLYELYISPPDGECLTDALAEAALRTEIAAARAAVIDPEDYDARANLMWTSAFALCGMLNNGKKTDWESHNIEHPISALYDVAHGAGLAVVHPAYLDYILPDAVPRLRRLAVNVWGIDPAGKTDEEIARAGVAATREFFRELGAPVTLGELGLGEDAIDPIADLTDLSCFSYRPITRADVVAILKSAL
jgi:alcohol dehydrogenase YqhD (iron-dependent ADH family)